MRCRQGGWEGGGGGRRKEEDYSNVKSRIDLCEAGHFLLVSNIIYYINNEMYGKAQHLSIDVFTYLCNYIH